MCSMLKELPLIKQMTTNLTHLSFRVEANVELLYSTLYLFRSRELNNPRETSTGNMCKPSIVVGTNKSI